MNWLKKYFQRFRKEAPTVVINSIDDLMLFDFIRILFRREYNRLAVSGQATEAQLSDAWAVVFEQYCSAIENSMYDELKMHMEMLIKMQSKIIVIKSSLMALATGYNEQAVKNLREIGYIVKFPADDPEAFSADMKKMIASAKTLSVKIQQVVIEIDKLKKTPGNNDSAESDFMDGIAIIGKWHGFRIDTKQTSVAEYCSMMRNYNRYLTKERVRNEHAKV